MTIESSNRTYLRHAPTTVAIGDRVQVREYDAATEGPYVGLQGLIVHIDQRGGRWVIIVLLDNDPFPSMQAMLGGLPCYEHELVKL